jgi:hypothetical protein
LRTLLAILVIRLAVAQPAAEGWRTYQDPQGRFEFQYPAAFGAISPGSDNGFGSRVAAVRFSEFSSGMHGNTIVFGGEAVVTSGPPQVDLQAAGGLYDSIALQALPVRAAGVIQKALPALTAATFCGAIGTDQHLDPADNRLTALTAQQRAGLPAVDRMGNHSPRVVRCEVLGDTVLFVKTSLPAAGAPPRHVYGAIRFLAGPYSSFQLVRATASAPEEALLKQVAALIRSWKRK